MEEGVGGVGLKMVVIMERGVSDLRKEIVFFEGGGGDDDCGMLGLVL